jgi:hypothetical protein
MTFGPLLVVGCSYAAQRQVLEAEAEKLQTLARVVEKLEQTSE